MIQFEKDLDQTLITEEDSSYASSSHQSSRVDLHDSDSENVSDLNEE